jgi:hypothetical protein
MTTSRVDCPNGMATTNNRVNQITQPHSPHRLLSLGEFSHIIVGSAVVLYLVNLGLFHGLPTS